MWLVLAVFQSLSGFQVRCNIVTADELNAMAMFQSLSGFQVRCNRAVFGMTIALFLLFQSLSGFQVRCNVV